MEKHTIHLTINGEIYELRVAPNELLVNVIRETVGLTGTKYACGTGQCGACTVVVDGEPILGCLTLAVTVDGSEDYHHRGGRESGRHPRSPAGSVSGYQRNPVRLLHTGHGAGGKGSVEEDAQPQ